MYTYKLPVSYVKLFVVTFSCKEETQILATLSGTSDKYDKLFEDSWTLFPRTWVLHVMYPKPGLTLISHCFLTTLQPQNVMLLYRVVPSFSRKFNLCLLSFLPSVFYSFPSTALLSSLLSLFQYYCWLFFLIYVWCTTGLTNTCEKVLFGWAVLGTG